MKVFIELTRLPADDYGRFTLNVNALQMFSPHPMSGAFISTGREMFQVAEDYDYIAGLLDAHPLPALVADGEAAAVGTP